MDEKTTLFFQILAVLSIFHGVKAILTAELSVKKTNPCEASAVLEWQFKGSVEDLAEPRNCSINHGPLDSFSQGRVGKTLFPNMSLAGSFALHLSPSHDVYTLQIICGSTKSETKNVTIDANDCGKMDDDETVIEYKAPPSLLSGKDSVLGIVFGLFGLVIILVTVCVLLMRYRQRRTLERIRRFVGARVIDPFENLQLRLDNDEAAEGTSRERLIGSTESLT